MISDFHRIRGKFTVFLHRVAFLLIMAMALGAASAQALQVNCTANSTTYQLAPGWNLISINLELDVASKARLRDKAPMVPDASSKAYVGSGDLAVSQACWIFCHAEGETLELEGDPPEYFDFFASLQPGWNFAGPLTDRPLNDDGIIAWGWNGRHFYPTDTLLAGHGYWIYLLDGCTRPPAEDTYLVIDLSAGTYSDSYPVSYLSAPPEGGWTDEYKLTKLVLRKLPAGTFMMGSPEDELGRYDHETQHQVTLTRDFYVGVFEVTQRQWNLVMGGWPSYFKNGTYGAFRPVEQVSYNMIRGASSNWPASNNVGIDSFVGRLRARTGLDFDLPTTAQWEYACRAGTTTALNSGKDLTDEKECPNLAEVGRYWYNGGKDYSELCDTSAGTNKVGSYLPNRWGLYDMHGNVTEWCLDWGDISDYLPEPVTDPIGDDEGTWRARRGGSWDYDARYCRAAHRANLLPRLQYNNTGFRMAMQPRQDNYIIIDLSAGPNADSYPVSYRSAPPIDGWTDYYKTTKLVLRKIPAGNFYMGSHEQETGRSDNETWHQVTMLNDFYTGVFEVTQKQWNLVMGTWPSGFANEDDHDARPVENISYDDIRGSNAGLGWPGNNAVDAASFLGKLRDKTGLNLDLPTDAQWEYACRAGTTTSLNSRNNINSTESCYNLSQVGHYKYNSGASGPDGGSTAKVGSYKPNLWGLYDMHGNVAEWCLDRYVGDLGNEEQANPSGPAEGDNRVVRNGSWADPAKDCRSARRSESLPAVTSTQVGFRLAVPPEPIPEDTYLIIDLSGGPEADNYPVSYRAAPPSGGWTEKHKTLKLVLRKIPAGTFTMGSPEDELGRWDNETQHQVTLTKDFYAGVFEITQKQWSLVMGDWPSYFKHYYYCSTRPVERISYNDIRGSDAGSGWPANNAVDDDSFLGRLRAKTGLDFDLPTSAQWEYACRADTITALNSGMNLTAAEEECRNMNKVGRYYFNSVSNQPGYDSDPSSGTNKVGSYKPNQWGLYDMHGNVYEWCLDWVCEYSTEAVTDPAGNADGEDRVVRGGSWDNFARNCRSAYYNIVKPSGRYRFLGFRIVMTLP
jgi:formylglycine-generating enzyme required for sulfatase activity